MRLPNVMVVWVGGKRYKGEIPDELAPPDLLKPKTKKKTATKKTATKKLTDDRDPTRNNRGGPARDS
jgi:hypothetical protein